MEATEGQTHWGQKLDIATKQGRSGGWDPNNSAGGGVSGVV